MLHNFLFSAIFHLFLCAIDQEVIDKLTKQGCQYCKSKLHQANYPRSPSGIPAQFRDHYNERFSLCCAVCRKRTTPPSVRFFGRRWFPAPIFILISMLQCGINERRLAQIKKHFGITVSESTWKRWRRWWREEFMTTKFWQQEKGMIRIEPTEKTNQLIPRALFNAFKKDLFTERIKWLLHFLSPLTGGILRAV
jgi:hypothetical protein